LSPLTLDLDVFEGLAWKGDASVFLRKNRVDLKKYKGAMVF
jgi:hypothetical protein